MIGFVVCGPGMYYGNIQPTTNTHIGYWYQGINTCVQYPENTVMIVPGNDQSLCVDAADACDGTTTVPSSDRFGCGKCG